MQTFLSAHCFGGKPQNTEQLLFIEGCIEAYAAENFGLRVVLPSPRPSLSSEFPFSVK